MTRYNSFDTMFHFRHIQQYLSELLHMMAEQKNLQNVSYLTKDIHVWPDFHGNRSPLADPTLKGMVLTHTLDPFLDVNLCSALQKRHDFYKLYISDIWIILISRSGKLGVTLFSDIASINGMLLNMNKIKIAFKILQIFNHKKDLQVNETLYRSLKCFYV